MEEPRRVECRMCKGPNDPRNAFCEYCGASLRQQGFRETGGKTWGRLLAKVSQRLLFVVVGLAILGGVYYAVDRFLLPVFRDDSPVVSVVTTTTALEMSTTTTTNPRKDKVIAGADRYATAIAVSRIGFPDGASGVVLAGGEASAEAICAVPLAAAYGGPILLVPPEGVTDELAAEIERLKPTTVFLVGVDRVSRTRSQVREILDDPEVKSLAGDSVYETAVLIATEIEAKIGKIEKAVLVPSDSFQEGIAVAPLAAANGWPILLTPQEGDVPRTTSRAIESLEITSLLMVGITAELDVDEVETKSGADVYETSALVAAYAAEQGLSFEHTALATGEGFPDGLVAGPFLAVDKGILLLTTPEALPDPVKIVFDRNAKSILRLDFVGLRALAEKMAVSGGSATLTTDGASTTSSGPTE